MSKKISISGEIGWDFMPSSFSDSLKEAKGGDLEIDIASLAEVCLMASRFTT